MQITEKLNSVQQVLPETTKNDLIKHFPIFNEMVEQGYEIDFYAINGFGGLTIVPSNNRIRVKVNYGAMQIPRYAGVLSNKIRQSFESRLENPNFQAGKKISNKFFKPKSFR